MLRANMLVMAVAAIILIGAVGAKAQPKTKAKHRPATSTQPVKHTPKAGNTTQLGADMMEGSNIRQQQPANGPTAKPPSFLSTIPTDYPNIKAKPKSKPAAKSAAKTRHTPPVQQYNPKEYSVDKVHSKAPGPKPQP